MGNLDQLLTVQDLDLRADQLGHRRTHLPERATLAGLQEDRTTLEKRTEAIASERDTLVREQKRYEDEAATVIAKAESTNASVYSGSVTSPRELQAMQDEIAALERRQTQLEDQVLDLMEKIEPLNSQLTDLEADHGNLSTRIDEISAEIKVIDAEIDKEEAEVIAERGGAVDGLPESLLAEYEKLRKSFGGVGAAKLSGHTCTGCHLSLSAIEVDRIKKLDGDAVVHCEECGRMLVR